MSPAPKSPMIWRYVPLACVGVLTLMFAVSLFQGDPQTLPSARAGRDVLPFSISRLNGGPVLTEQDLKTGAPILLNVWASWCGPCRDEHPLLMALRQKGVTIIGLNYKDRPEAAKRFLAQLGNPYEMIGVDETGRVAIDLGVYGVPETFLIDAQGRVVDRHVGPIDEAFWVEKLTPFLAQLSSPPSAASKRE